MFCGFLPLRRLCVELRLVGLAVRDWLGGCNSSSQLKEKGKKKQENNRNSRRLLLILGFSDRGTFGDFSDILMVSVAASRLCFSSS